MPPKRLTPTAKPRDDSVVISMRLPKALVRQIDRLAAREDRSRNKMLELAARHYVETNKAA